MKKIAFVFLLIICAVYPAAAQEPGIGVLIKEADDNPTGYAYQLIFPNTTLTDNGDGTFTFSLGALGGGDMSTGDWDGDSDTYIDQDAGGLDADISGYGAGLLGHTAAGAVQDTDTEAEVETALGGINIIVSTEIDAFSEINALVADKTLINEEDAATIDQDWTFTTGLILGTTGDVTQTAAAVDWDMIDNTASALSFDAADKAGILAITTTDSSEGVTMSGTLGVTGQITGTALIQANAGVTIATGQALTLGTTRWDNSSDKIDGDQIADDTIDDDSIDFGDVTAADITMTDAGQITASGLITANANLTIANGATTAGVLTIMEDSDNGSNYTSITVGSQAANITYILPTAQGTSNQYLQLENQSTGQLKWNDPGGTGDITAVGNVSSGTAFTGVDADGNTGYQLYFEGTSVNNYEILLTSENPGADVTITLPAETGTVMLGPSDLGTDNILVKTDGTGNLVQATGISVADTTNNVTGVGTISSGAITATGTSTFADAITPDSADSATLGTATVEWSDIYLSDGAVIYGQADSSNTLTSSATDWTFGLDITVTGNEVTFGNGEEISNATDGSLKLTDGTNEIAIFTTVGSAAAELTFLPATTGGNPVIRTSGENDAGIRFENAESEELLVLDSVGTDVNYLSIQSSATGTGLDNQVSLTAAGDNTNVGIIVDPKGTGTLTLGSSDANIVIESDAFDVSESGAVSGVTTLTLSTNLIIGTSDPADAGTVRLENGASLVWEDGTEANITHVNDVGFTTNLSWQAEHLISTDDADINDNLTAGDIIIDEAAGVLDFSGATSGTITASTAGVITFGDVVDIYSANADPADQGQLLHDSIITNISGGGLRWYDTGALGVRLLVDLDTDPSDTDGGDEDQVVAYDPDLDKFYMKNDADSGGSPKWNNINAPDDNDEIDFGAYTIELNVTDFQVGDGGGTNIVKFTGGSGGQFQLGATGVQFTSDNDGAFTMLGIGTGADEDLTLNFDDTSNEVTVSTSTGVTLVDFDGALDLEISGNDLTLGEAGVKFTSDGDGALTLLGLGDGYDEDLTINFDDTENTITVSSSTSVGTVDFGTINLETGVVEVDTALQTGSSPADAGEVRMSNTDSIEWEIATPGTNVTIAVDANDDMLLTTAATDFVGVVTGNWKVGNGTPGSSGWGDGEDGYVEGQLEVDGAIYADGGIEAAAVATPTITFDDSDSTAETSDAVIYAEATDDGDGTEDVDLFLQVQVASTLTTGIQIDADGNIIMANHVLQLDTGLDVNEDIDIDFNSADEEIDITNSAELDNGLAQVTIYNSDDDLTDGDLTANMYLLRLKYKDDGDADGAFLVCQDNDNDEKFIIDADGAVTLGGITTSGNITDGTATWDAASYTLSGFSSISGSTVTGATTIGTTSLTAGIDNDTAGTIYVHHGGSIVLADAGNDTTVTLGPVGDGTTTLGITGTLNASGLQVSGTAVQVQDTELTALAGLTFTDYSIIQLTGAGAASVLQSGGNNYMLGSTSDNTALEFKTPAAVADLVGAAFTAGDIADNTIIDADIDDDGNFTFTGTWDFASGALKITTTTSGDQTRTIGQIGLKADEDLLVTHGGSAGEVQDEAGISLIDHVLVVIDPAWAYDQEDTYRIFPLLKLGDDFPHGLTLVEWRASFISATRTTGLDMDLVCDTTPDYNPAAGATVMDAMDIANSAQSSTADTGFDSATCANAAQVYLRFGADPTDANELLAVDIWFYRNED